MSKQCETIHKFLKADCATAIFVKQMEESLCEERLQKKQTIYNVSIDKSLISI